MRWLWLPLALLGIAAMAYGVHLGQHTWVRSHAMTLCTACIGLE
ncbi:MAG: hypothetical protein U9R79_01295 [Armatimonadota bacterium]|nr:hypothetical protein [Armatimonadota bacterium]